MDSDSEQRAREWARGEKIYQSMQKAMGRSPTAEDRRERQRSGIDVDEGPGRCIHEYDPHKW